MVPPPPPPPTGHFVVDKIFSSGKMWRVTDGRRRVTNGGWRVNHRVMLHQT